MKPELEKSEDEDEDEYADDDFDEDEVGGCRDEDFLNASASKKEIEDSYGESDFEEEADVNDCQEEAEAEGRGDDGDDDNEEEEEESEDEEEDYDDDDDFDEYDPEDDKLKSALRDPNHPRTGAALGARVKFQRKLVTSVRERPKTAPTDVSGLFYTETEIARFEDAAYMEESRGLAPGTLDEDEVARLLQAQGMEIQISQSSAQNDGGIETYEDFSDDSFDAEGFDDDF